MKNHALAEETPVTPAEASAGSEEQASAEFKNPFGTPEETQVPPAKKKDPMSAPKELLEWLELFAYAVAFVIVLFTFFCRVAVVNGGSMEKTLHENQVLIVSDMFYEPEQGDIIVFQSNTILGNEAIVKRVIATEGQVVDIDFQNWIVTVDGKALEEPYVNYMPGQPMDGSRFQFPMTVEPGHIFVMGDNRNFSTDSRSTLIGQVDTRFVLGHVLARVFPLNTFTLMD